jgi:hypothetical protein
MTHYDVFNGDADGILALHQLRLAHPLQSVLVTGVKRDINLLQRVDAVAGDTVTALDISLDKNRTALEKMLAAGVAVEYFDHHFAGDIPSSPLLTTHIDTTADVCTSLLVNAALNGQYLPWAVTAAFGDNLYEAAQHAAAPLALTGKQLDALRELGTYINYNGYGTAMADLFFPPDELYTRLHPYTDPFAFIHEDAAYGVLAEGYAADMARTQAIAAEIDKPAYALFILPDAAWARRVSGVFANTLAQQNPGRAHAMLTATGDGAFLVSVRAPLATRTGADELCRKFPTGGGRKAAAGINRLEADRYDDFVTELAATFG